MIDPQPAYRGMLGEQHGLARLTTTLEALTQNQDAQAQRDTHLQEQLRSQAQQLARLTTGSQRLFLAVLGLAGLVVVAAGLVGWQITHPPALEYARALGTLDQAVAQQWPQLPPKVQEHLSATYGRLGLVAPGQRK